ncbi:GNAT family N-acetyltransferase [uncultured Roseivirga sp.]|jgi:predicted GNAT family acetyltransferase|uniref:GNAT family N-acetyltransferase n=1 Tax=uncultured Roseivirga sp. TaxID=543088 RepID=UPI000D79F15D|nr:GNAT family N-acetyltransferase [uncultured Roseivirga sp.]PWL32165.1 MAG: GNAT family N-acetyltransferase [Roseivirga sp. XM-24bin3]
MDWKIQVKEHENKGSFYIEENEEIVAEMTFSKAGDQRIIIDHTEISDGLRGKGVGLKLVEFAVDYVRSKNIKMLPLCPFVKSTLLKHPEWKDVW